MDITKQNVVVFNKDVEENDGYLYSIDAPYSSIIANNRITDEISLFIKGKY